MDVRKRLCTCHDDLWGYAARFCAGGARLRHISGRAAEIIDGGEIMWVVTHPTAHSDDIARQEGSHSETFAVEDPQFREDGILLPGRRWSLIYMLKEKSSSNFCLV